MKRAASRILAAGALLTALMAASGCSWLGLGDDDESKRPTPPGANAAYPNLATVPNKTPNTGTTRERLQIEEGLLADRTNARYVSGPTAGEDRPSSLPPERGTRPNIIDPRAARPQGERNTAANNPPAAPQRSGPIGSITYANGSAALPEGSGRFIVRASEAQRRFGGTIVVVGHAAAAEGDAAARQALATQRATAVANGLLNLGVERGNIRVGTSNGRVDAARVDIALQGAR